MKSNNSFIEIIKAYLDKRASEDSLFAQNYAKKAKNITDCCAYIKDRARKIQSRGCAVVSDDEVFGWAVHYYDEDDIKVNKKVDCRVETSVSSNKPEALQVKTKVKKTHSNVLQLNLFG